MSILLEVVVILAISGGIYYGLPLWLAKMYAVNYKVHPAKGAPKQKGFLVKPDPNHALIAVQGTRIVRYLMGGQYVLARKNNRYNGEEGFNSSLENILPYAIPKRAGDKFQFEELGGELSLLFSFLEGWIFSVTGCRFIGTNFAEVLSAELASYKAKRPEEVRSSTPTTDKDDKSRYVVLSEQVIDLLVKDSETGGEVVIDGQKVRTTARFNSKVQVVVIVIDILKAFFGVDEYFPTINAQISSAVNEMVRGATIDNLLDMKWVKDEIEHAPLLRNGSFPGGYPIGDVLDPIAGISEYRRALKHVEDPNGSDKDVNNNVIQLYGFMFISASLIEGDFDEETRKGFELRQKAFIDVQTAEREMQAAKLRAEGQASYTERELEALAKAARDLRGSLGGRAADVLVAQQHGRAARDAGEGVIVSLGGSSPTPLIQLDQGGRGKRDRNEGNTIPQNGN